MAKSTIALEFENLTKKLTSDVQQILSDNKEEFKKCVSDEANRTVYPAYTPNPLTYQRRMESGGLSDCENYEVIEGNLSLTLTNNTRSNPDYWKYSYSVPTTEIVEEGSGDGWVGVPSRPFMDKALERFAYEIIEPKIKELLGGN